VIEPSPLERGRALAAAGKHEAALETLLGAVADDPTDVGAHLALYEVAQLIDRPELALEHQRCAIALAPVHSTPARGREAYALLVASVPGPFTANTPVDLLFDPECVTIHRWYVDPDRAIPPLPPFDAVFVAAGESQAAQRALGMLAELLPRQPAPVVNRPERIARLGRIRFAELFAGARRCRVVTTVRLTREAYAERGFPLPHIVRPVDSHGGHALERIDDDAGRAAYLADVDAPELYVQPFVDYRSRDGFYRKYRVIFVDGEPYPFHLAISPRWMVHYYNAAMTEHQWMRDEEHAFLARMGDVFDGELRAALDEAAQLLALDYVGIDCAIDRDGRLLIFEADNALLVHLLDDRSLFPYKFEYVPRIYAAVDAMLRGRIGR
jgi:glutathione synthase/RimK-type ligase-like ATP-grasp enzyme